MNINIIIRKIYSIICRLRGLIKGCSPNVRVGRHLFCESNVEIHTKFGGNVNLGDFCILHSGCKILTYGGDISIGHHCSINPYTILYGQGNLTIGNYVRIAADCVIIPSNHNFSDLDTPIMFQGLTNKGIIIEDDVWIGCCVRVLDGVTISKGCVIGAGSVVTRSTLPYGIYVGVPARFINFRNHKCI